MKLGKTLYAPHRKAWRAWLQKHHLKSREIWLVYYRKSSGRRRIPYNDAVEEALCFGWIDSIVKRVDDARFAQRFSPRRNGSVLSQPNRERLRKMIAAGKMTSAGLAAVSHAFSPKSRERLSVPADMLAEIRKNPDAWKHFKALPESYKRVRIAYIEGYRGTAMFRKSLRHFIAKTAKNKRYGFVTE